jgi:hypothetical protein
MTPSGLQLCVQATTKGLARLAIPIDQVLVCMLIVSLRTDEFQIEAARQAVLVWVGKA